MTNRFLAFKIPLLVWFFSMSIAFLMLWACWDINIWPTDAEHYYMPAAQKLFDLPYLSSMHEGFDTERIKWLHGKEIHVLSIALLQKCMGDTQTLRPLILLGVISIFISSILIFYIGRRIWSEFVGLIIWILFITSFWPYLYILFAKHQTQGLMFSLLAIASVVFCRYAVAVIIAGFYAGLAMFSSTVSFLYIPLIVAAIVYSHRLRIKNIFLFVIGVGLVIVYVNFPHVINNIQHYLDYVKISSAYNHFMYNQRILVQWIPTHLLSQTRPGLCWVIPYLFLVMPLVLPLALVSIYHISRRWGLFKSIGWVALGFMPVFLAEIKGVAQYGANYFPVLLGMLLLIALGLSALLVQPMTRLIKMILVGVLFVHMGINTFVFASDIYPSRMCTTLISNYIKQKGFDEVYTYKNHPLEPYIVENLNPDLLRDLKVTGLQTILMAPQRGCLLLPSVKVDSIYRASNNNYTDFDDDLALNRMVATVNLNDYAFKSFKTMGSSLIWSQEEEIFAYRTLVKGHKLNGDLSKAWLLDLSKISKDREKFLPTQEQIRMHSNKVRLVGTKTKQLMYTGYEGNIGSDILLKGIVVRMFKVGNPSDQVRAYVFKLDDQQPMWITYGPQFASVALSAAKITASPEGNLAAFEFNPPLPMKAGAFSVVIYRQGRESDQDYYGIYADILGRIE